MENLCSWTFANLYSWTFARILVRGPSRIFVRGPLFVHSSQHIYKLIIFQQCFLTVGNCLGQTVPEGVGRVV